MKLPKNVVIYAAWILLVGGALLIRCISDVVPVPIKKPLSSFPAEINGWTGAGKRSSDYLVTALGADDLLVREYIDPYGDRVELFAAYFNYTKEKKAPHAPQLCWVGSGWAFKDLGEEPIATGCKKCPNVIVRTVLAERDGAKTLLLYTYKINGRYVTDLLKFRLMSVVDTVFRRRNSAFTVQASSRVGEEGIDRKVQLMKDFLSKVFSVAENEFLP